MSYINITGKQWHDMQVRITMLERAVMTMAPGTAAAQPAPVDKVTLAARRQAMRLAQEEAWNQGCQAVQRYSSLGGRTPDDMSGQNPYSQSA
jgi:hypothetical protein